MIEYGNRTVTGTYDCTEDFFDFLNGNPVNPGSAWSASYWRSYEADSWMGLDKRDTRPGERAGAATMRLAREGWPRGADMVMTHGERLDVPTILSIKRRGVWCDQGDEVEMQRIWSGDLDTAWRTTKKRPTRSPTRVRIVLDSLASCAVSSETMAMRGAAAIRLCDALTTAGYSVEMRSAWQGDAKDQFFLSVTVKSFDMPVDIGSLAATVGLPSFFRALGHQWGPMASKQAYGGASGYQVQDLDEGRFEEPNVLLFCIGQGIETISAANEWIRGCVNTLNGINEEQAIAA